MRQAHGELCAGQATKACLMTLAFLCSFLERAVSARMHGFIAFCTRWVDNRSHDFACLRASLQLASAPCIASTPILIARQRANAVLQYNL